MIRAAWTAEAAAQIARAVPPDVLHGLWVDWLRGNVTLLTDEARRGWLIVEQIDDDSGREVFVPVLAGSAVVTLLADFIGVCRAGGVAKITAVARSPGMARLHQRWGRHFGASGDIVRWAVQEVEQAAPPTMSARTSFLTTWVVAPVQTTT